MQLPVVERGWLVKGLRAGRGVMVLTSDYVAFVPTERPKHLGVEIAWGIAGFVEVGATKIPPELMIDRLGSNLAQDAVDAVAQALDGRLWSSGAATIREHRIPLRRSKRGLWIERAGESIRLGRSVPAEDVAALRVPLRHWVWVTR